MLTARTYILLNSNTAFKCSCPYFSEKMDKAREDFVFEGDKWKRKAMDLEKLQERKLSVRGGGASALHRIHISFPNKEGDPCHLDCISCCLIKSGMTLASPLLMVIISTPPSPLPPTPTLYTHTTPPPAPYHPHIWQRRGTGPDIYTKTRRRCSPAAPAALSVPRL